MPTLFFFLLLLIFLVLNEKFLLDSYVHVLFSCVPGWYKGIIAAVVSQILAKCLKQQEANMEILPLFQLLAIS